MKANSKWAGGKGKGGNRKFSDICWGKQFIFMNLNPIPGAQPSLVVKNDTSQKHTTHLILQFAE